MNISIILNWDTLRFYLKLFCNVDLNTQDFISLQSRLNLINAFVINNGLRVINFWWVVGLRNFRWFVLKLSFAPFCFRQFLNQNFIIYFPLHAVISTLSFWIVLIKSIIDLNFNCQTWRSPYTTDTKCKWN